MADLDWALWRLTWAAGLSIATLVCVAMTLSVRLKRQVKRVERLQRDIADLSERLAVHDNDAFFEARVRQVVGEMADGHDAGE